MEQPRVVTVDRWYFYTSGHKDRFHCIYICTYVCIYISHDVV